MVSEKIFKEKVCPIISLWELRVSLATSAKASGELISCTLHQKKVPEEIS